MHAQVDGEPTWAHAESRAGDLEYMVRCCIAELQAMEQGGPIAAPFYFLRTAILLRKAKDAVREVQVCEAYIGAAARFYAAHSANETADVRQGPTYQKIVARLRRAREKVATLPL